MNTKNSIFQFDVIYVIIYLYNDEHLDREMHFYLKVFFGT